MSRILVYSRTTGYRHASIPAGIAALEKLGARHGFTVEASEGAHSFRPDRLERYAAIVFLSTSGAVLDEPGREALTRYMRQGGSWLGIHAASTTEYEWPWFEGLVGAWFDQHPEIQPAVLTVEDRDHPATEFLGEKWNRTDEWYAFRSNPRERAEGEKPLVLLTVDEATYRGGTMGADHPLAWCREYEGGRSFYTALGHAAETYQDPEFLAHLVGALRWLGVGRGAAADDADLGIDADTDAE
jgi:type 1 glutamine amidotransferase